MHEAVCVRFYVFIWFSAGMNVYDSGEQTSLPADCLEHAEVFGEPCPI